MKKASFTKIRPRSWMDILGRSLFLILLACTFVSIHTGIGQTYYPDIAHPLKLDADGQYHPSTKIVTCSEYKTTYTDDNHFESTLYYDKVARTDTLQFCGKDAWHRVIVTFSEFDLAPGDELLVFDGDTAALNNAILPVFTTLAGSAVSSANGGWVSASCSPTKNPSGCLTFIFKTNGDNGKGTGWKASVECDQSSFSLDAVVQNAKLNCGDQRAWVGIPVPTFKGECTGENFDEESICLIIRRQNGNICPIRAATDRTNTDGTTLATTAAALMTADTLCGTIEELRYIGLDGVAGTAGAPGDDIIASLDLTPGQYTYEIFLKDSPTKKVLKPFSVSLPSLVCNDEVEIPLNSGCGLQIAPDDILENPCFESLMSYELEVTLGKGPKQDTVIKHTILTGSGAAIGGGVALWISRDVLEKFQGGSCSGSIDVKITRVFTPPSPASATAVDLNNDATKDVNTNYCDNGPIRTSCHTIINYKDLTAPAIQIHSDIDTIVACNKIEVESLLGSLVIDNCDKYVRETYYIDYEESDGCFSKDGTPGVTEATVTITATDACGNSNSTTKDFVIKRPSEFVVPQKSLKLQCHEYGNPIDLTKHEIPGVKVGYIKSNNEFVVTDTMHLSQEEYICGYILVKDKIKVPDTDCGKKEIYEWKAIDWCNASGGPSIIGNQFVEYTDTVAPAFTGVGAKGFDVELGHFECTYDASNLPAPEAIDNCSSPTVYIEGIFRLEDGTKWRIDKKDWKTLDTDSFEVRWVTEDACHEQQKQDTTSQLIVVKDVSKPSVITTDELIVSVPNDWGAIIKVDDVDAGSYDACGLAYRDIRREDDPDGWGPHVTLGCEDIGKAVKVYLRVVDYRGNENTAWMIVRPEDRIPAVCNNLENIYLDCSEMHISSDEIAPPTDSDGDGRFEDSEWVALTGETRNHFILNFGQFNCSDNVSCNKLGTPENSIEEYQLINLQCGQMEIRRRFRLRNDAVHQFSESASNWAYQTINVGSSGNWKVTLPADVVGECKDDISKVVPPIIEASACDVIAWEVEDRVFGNSGDACLKIERTYHIINWCNYSPGGEQVQMARQEGYNGEVYEPRMVIANGTTNNGLGYFTYIQILKIQDHEAPVVTVTNPEDGCINGVDFDAFPFGEEDNTPGAAPHECDEIKTWSATAVDCTDRESIRWVGRLYDADHNLVKEVNYHTLTYPVGNKESYYAEFWAYDGCGNSGGATSNLMEFWDCRPPVAYLLNGVAININPNGLVDFWASDLDRGSFDNCTDQDHLKFYLHDPHGDLPQPTTYEEVIDLPQVINYDCTKLGTQAITIYVVDEEGNYDFASSSVNIQDNSLVCQGLLEETEQGLIAGSIINSDGEAVEEVEVTVNGGMTTMNTDANGSYHFALRKGKDYTVTPEKNVDPLNGVSTFDLVLISKHILGIESLDSPYKQIAADVNRSGTVTAFDMVQLRQLILNIITEFPNNESWRFVDASHAFSSDPLKDNYNEFKSVNNLDTDMMKTDFVAIKVGDVNENAVPNSLSKSQVRTSNEEMILQLDDQLIKAGQTVTVDISTETLPSIEGYQFTMNYEGLILESIENGVATQEHFNTNLRNAFTTSWNKTNDSKSSNELFTLNFIATTSGQLSEFLSLNSDYTSIEAYDEEGQILDISLAYTDSQETAVQLMQNKPNPFKEFTKIGFRMATSGEATLKVLDVQGRVLKTINGTYPKGYNEIQLNAKELRTTGILYYQFETNDFIATKKMFVIE